MTSLGRGGISEAEELGCPSPNLASSTGTFRSSSFRAAFLQQCTSSYLVAGRGAGEGTVPDLHPLGGPHEGLGGPCSPEGAPAWLQHQALPKSEFTKCDR